MDGFKKFQSLLDASTPVITGRPTNLNLISKTTATAAVYLLKFCSLISSTTILISKAKNLRTSELVLHEKPSWASSRLQVNSSLKIKKSQRKLRINKSIQIQSSMQIKYLHGMISGNEHERMDHQTSWVRSD